jgi:hypothetical protein
VTDEKHDPTILYRTHVSYIIFRKGGGATEAAAFSFWKHIVFLPLHGALFSPPYVASLIILGQPAGPVMRNAI